MGQNRSGSDGELSHAHLPTKRGIACHRFTRRLPVERMKTLAVGIRNIIACSDKLGGRGSIIHLELGEPDFGTPAHIIDACKKALDNQEVHYGPIAGTVELARPCRTLHPVWPRVRAGRNAHVRRGPRRLSVHAYLDGDEILVPDPGYRSILPTHISRRPSLFPIRCAKNGFKLDAETLEALITPRTKAI